MKKRKEKILTQVQNENNKEESRADAKKIVLFELNCWREYQKA